MGKAANRKRRELFERLGLHSSLNRGPKRTSKPRVQKVEPVIKSAPSCYCRDRFETLPNHFVVCHGCPLTAPQE